MGVDRAHLRTHQPSDAGSRAGSQGRARLTGYAPPTVTDVLELQQIAGNAAVADVLAGRQPVVQRHSAFEHAIMSNTKPSDVKEAHVGADTTAEAWRHILDEELNRVLAFKDDPAHSPIADYPQVRWVQLGTSKLWVSPGELSALGDYLPDPESIDTMSAKALIPVLQRMRQTIARSIAYRLEYGDTDRERNRMTRMKGAAGLDPETATFHNPLRDISEDAAEVNDLDEATASLGPNRQKGLLARNACHFAPFSWERWSLYHNEARNLAKEAHGTKAKMSLKMRERQPMKDAERKAWIANSYANHFLQDSFAAGHLINKTLVMQWFAEYTKNLGWWDKPRYGLPGKDVLGGMSEKKQPDIGNRRTYTDTRLHTSASEDRASGRVVTDPQTALERSDQEGRLAGSGVRSKDPEGEKEFRQYEAFLNSTFISLAALDIHDYFNRTGVTVTNEAGQQFVVGGDGHMLSIQSEESIGVALEANTLADQAISDLLSSGTTKVEVEDIFKRVPSKVVIEGDAIGLEKWNDTVVKQYCLKHIFPAMASSTKYRVVRAAGSKLVDDGRILTPKDR
jgi:hypothetical protein